MTSATWEHKSLEDVCSLITDGSHFSPKTYSTGDFPYITVRDIRDGEVDFSKCQFISEVAFKGLQKTGCQPESGDVLFSKDGTVGKVAIVKDFRPFVVLSSLAILRPNPALVSAEFLAFVLQSPTVLEDALGMKTGTAIRRVVLRNLKKLVFPLPPLREQKRIVEALEDQLSKLDKALAGLNYASIKSNHLFLAALEQAIAACSQSTYEPLNDCLESLESGKYVQRGWSPQCLSYPQSDQSKWAVLKTTAVQNMRYEPQHNKELPKTLEPKRHLEVRPGDFLMTTTGPRNRCGVVCFVPDTPAKLIFSGKILRFRPSQTRVQPAWLELVLASQKYQKQLDSLKVGSSDSSVSIGNAQVLDLKIPVPSLEEQRQLVTDVQKIKELSTLFELEISKEYKQFQLLRRSLLSAAFAGNLGIE